MLKDTSHNVFINAINRSDIIIFVPCLNPSAVSFDVYANGYKINTLPFLYQFVLSDAVVIGQAFYPVFTLHLCYVIVRVQSRYY